METLLSLTSEDLYPWFEPPTAAEKEGGGGRGGPKTGPDAAAWRAMFDLASGGALVTNLTRHHPDTFPGSGLMVRVVAV